MANLIVQIELRGGAPTAPSLFALGEARRVAREIGASVYALLTTGELPPVELDALVSGLGVAGADRVLLCHGPTLGGAPLDATHGEAVAAVAARIPPVLFLLPAGAIGPELGPRLAARLGAGYAPRSDIEIDRAAGGPARVTLLRWRRAGDACRRLDPADIERAVVATLRAGDVPAGVGTTEIEVEMIACTERDALVSEIASEPDENAAVELARGLVLLPPGAGPEALAALRAAAPSGVVVTTGEAIPDALRELACPTFVLGVGVPVTAVAGTPRTRAAVVGGEAARLAPAPGPDVIWNEDPAAAVSALTATLRAATDREVAS